MNWARPETPIHRITARPLDHGISDSYFSAVAMKIRELRRGDREQWQPLWDGYNLFYERPEFPAEITDITWERFLDPAEPMHAAVAELDGKIVGIVHYLYHRSTTNIERVCYLQDLFTAPDARSLGIGRALIEHVYDEATKGGSRRVYWHTHEENPARKLYDQVAQVAPFRRYLKELS